VSRVSLLTLACVVPEANSLLQNQYLLAAENLCQSAAEKTCQHSAMKHPKQNKRAPQTHPSALAVPSYHRILVKHGLIEKTLSIPDAYKVFLKAGADPEVQKLRRKVERGNRMKHVPALYLATAMALQGMTKQELEALKLRIEEKRV
jgi:hypothetical protein